MIQTQLLKADPPYQIIAAAGQVGVQVATLIVTEDKSGDGHYEIDTHSHPVVNYAVKEGLTEEMKYWRGDPREEYKYTLRLQPEGAVWNKVEIRDVHVLGLVGADNPVVELENFVSLVPAIPYSGLPAFMPVWDSRTPAQIRNLRWGLEKVGLKCATSTANMDAPRLDGSIHILLKKVAEKGAEPLVKVTIREAEEVMSWPPICEISFSCPLGDDPTTCMNTIVTCMRELDDQFIRGGGKIRFYHPANETDETLKRMVEHINSLMWKQRYGLG